RIVAAKAGVPMKTRSRAFPGGAAVIIRSPRTPALGRDGNSAALCLGELAQDHSALDQREVVDKEDAVEVLDLVLQAGGEEPRGVHLTDLVLMIEVAQPNLGRAGDVGIMLGQRQAPLAEGRELGRMP